MGTGEDRLSEGRRQQLLDRIGRQSATIGTNVPESVTIGGTDLNLREFVAETGAMEFVPPEHRQRVREVRATLSHERSALKARLENDPLTVEEATRIADTIVGLDRAIAALDDLRTPDREIEARERSLEDSRAWLSLINQILD